MQKPPHKVGTSLSWRLKYFLVGFAEKKRVGATLSGVNTKLNALGAVLGQLQMNCELSTARKTTYR